MTKKSFQTYLRWLHRTKSAAGALSNESTFIRESYGWKYKTYNDLQIANCIKLYNEDGVVPTFTSEAVRYLCCATPQGGEICVRGGQL